MAKQSSVKKSAKKPAPAKPARAKAAGSKAKRAATPPVASLSDDLAALRRRRFRP